MPADRGDVFLGEGRTPLIPLPRLARRIGVTELFGKLELCNPTGSYKDRVAARSMAAALQRRNAGWIATSSGNAGTSLAAYGARAGLPGILFVVPSIPPEKRLPAQALGAEVIRVAGLGDEATARSEHAVFEVLKAAAEEFNLFLAITAHAYNEQGMRGADDIGLEIAQESAGRETHVYIPSGGGGLAVAVGRGLERARSPARIVLAQPEGCAPIVRVLRGELARPNIDSCTTKISGLQLPAPPDGELAVAAALASNGWGTSVSDPAILRAQRLLGESEGLFVEPASATAVAACQADRAAGRLDQADCPVLVLTGSGLKAMRSLDAVLPEPPIIEPGGIEQQVVAWLGRCQREGTDSA